MGRLVMSTETKDVHSVVSEKRNGPSVISVPSLSAQKKTRVEWNRKLNVQSNHTNHLGDEGNNSDKRTEDES